MSMLSVLDIFLLKPYLTVVFNKNNVQSFPFINLLFINECMHAIEG